MSFEVNKAFLNNYKKIIIKYDDKITSTYSLNTYNEYPFLQEYISKQNFIEILDKANIIIYSAKMKKAKFDKVEVNKITYILVFISVIFIIIYIFLFYYAPRVSINNSKLKVSGIIFFCLAVIIIIGIELFFSFSKIHGDKTLFYFYKKDMLNYIDNLNKKWKNVMFFKFDKSNKNIICFVKINKDYNENDDYSENNIISTRLLK